jgi:hypothetical protein
MRRLFILSVLFLGFFDLLVFYPSFICAQKNPAKETMTKEQAILKRIEQLTGAKGEYIAKENVYKVGFPRSDIKLDISGVKMAPAMGLGVWASFKISGAVIMVMGDTVMTEDQVNPVMSAALDNGLEVTAIHNHFFWDNPKIMFMHIGGMAYMDSGGLETLAAAVGKVFMKIKETSGGKGEKPYVEIDPSKTALDSKKIENVLGVKGQLSNGVYKITIGRTTSMHNVEVGNAMGINTWAAFAGSDNKAVVDGDFVMLEEEVQPVLKALRRAGINIVALHNHMMMESPKMMFLHFWGIGSTTNLARGLKAAMDTQQKEKNG